MYFRDTFVIFDKDGDGTIDSKELSTVLRAMGYNPSKVRLRERIVDEDDDDDEGDDTGDDDDYDEQEEVREMVDQVDVDGSGSIEFLEFLLLMGRMIKDIPSDNDLRDVFVGENNSVEKILNPAKNDG